MSISMVKTPSMYWPTRIVDVIIGDGAVREVLYPVVVSAVRCREEAELGNGCGSIARKMG